MLAKIWFVGICWAGLLVTTSVAAQNTPQEKQPGLTSEQEASVRQTPYLYSSEEGEFQVVWPGGCGKLRQRFNEPEYYVDEDHSQDPVLVRAVSCDRFGAKGEGCSVIAIFDERSPDGGAAGSAEVVARVKKLLTTYGASIIKQTAIQKEYADGTKVEGIDVIAKGTNGIGRVWLRGLLSHHDIYLLSAWSVTEDLWKNPEYQEFFNSFVPHAE